MKKGCKQARCIAVDLLYVVNVYLSTSNGVCLMIEPTLFWWSVYLQWAVIIPATEMQVDWAQDYSVSENKFSII